MRHIGLKYLSGKFNDTELSCVLKHTVELTRWYPPAKTEIFVNISSGNGIFMMAQSYNLYQRWLIINEVLWHKLDGMQVHKECSRYLFLVCMSFKITHIRLWLHLPGATALIWERRKLRQMYRFYKMFLVWCLVDAYDLLFIITIIIMQLHLHYAYHHHRHHHHHLQQQQQQWQQYHLWVTFNRFQSFKLFYHLPHNEGMIYTNFPVPKEHFL